MNLLYFRMNMLNIKRIYNKDYINQNMKINMKLMKIKNHNKYMNLI